MKKRTSENRTTENRISQGPAVNKIWLLTIIFNPPQFTTDELTCEQ